MNISKVKDCIYVGSVEPSDEGRKSNLKMKYNKEVDTSILSDPSGRVYFLVVDGIIKKIGGSACKGGIKSTMNFYMSGNCGSPSLRSFGINLHMMDNIDENKSVDIYMVTSSKVDAEVRGLFSSELMKISAFKEMEDKCVQDYVSVAGKYPDWNYQESNQEWPKDIHEKYLEHRSINLTE